MLRLQALSTLFLLALVNFYLVSAMPMSCTVEPASSYSNSTAVVMEAPSDSDLTRRMEPGLLWKGDPMLIKAQPIYTENYCIPNPDLPQCTFATRLSTDQTVAEWFAYDHWCKLIGHWGNNLVPSNRMGFASELPGWIWSSQEGPGVAPTKVEYEYEPGQFNKGGDAYCYNSGESNIAPNFRMACRVEFDCPPRK